jgi:TRAP-type C4-dicarboxylate transport system permease small subunit
MLVYYGYDITLTAIPQRSTAVPWLSLGVIYACMPLGALLMIPISLELMLKNLAESIRKLK